jgi:hypothetical protein
VARTERKEINTEFWWGNLEESEHLEDLGLDGLKVTLIRTGRRGLDLFGSGGDPVAG